MRFNWPLVTDTNRVGHQLIDGKNGVSDFKLRETRNVSLRESLRGFCLDATPSMRSIRNESSQSETRGLEGEPHFGWSKSWGRKRSKLLRVTNQSGHNTTMTSRLRRMGTVERPYVVYEGICKTARRRSIEAATLCGLKRDNNVWDVGY